MRHSNHAWYLVTLAAAAMAGCTATFGIDGVDPTVPGDDDDGPGDDGNQSGTCGVDEFATGNEDIAGPDYVLEIDSAALDPFVEGGATTAPVSGTVESTAGISAVTVGGAPATVEGNAFSATAPMSAGLVKVPIVVTDAAGHERRGDRALLATAFLPEGATNIDAAALVLDDDILAAMIEPYIEEVADIDIAQSIRDQAGNLSQQGCEVNLDRVSAGRAQIRMYVGPGGTMDFDFTVPDVDVSFSGLCDSFFMSATFDGRIQTDVVVRTTISVPYNGACADQPGHSYPEVELPGYQMDLDIQQQGGGGGGLMDLMMPIIEEILKGVIEDQMATQIAEEADTLIGEQTSQFAAFDAENAFSFAETDIEVGFCLTELGPSDGQLRARVGLSAQGPGQSSAPGAPMAPGEMPGAAPSTLFVDSNLIGQMMFSLWSAGSFHREVEGMATVGMIALAAPALGDKYCSDTPVTIAINGIIPPYVYAAEPGSGADLVVEIGDLQIDLLVEGEKVLGIGSNVKVTLELQPQGSALMPVVSNLEVETFIRSEPMAEFNDELVLGVVEMQFGDQVDALLGEGGFELPQLGGLTLMPTDVQPDPGGRFLLVSLQ